MSAGRPQFHREIGKVLAELRKAKDWSQGQAVIQAKGRIKIGTLKSLESGRIKHPDAKDLRTLATLYGVGYQSLAGRFVAENYGPDLVRQIGDLESGRPQDAGGPLDDSASTRLLRQENKDLKATLGKVEHVARQLLKLAAAGVEDAEVASTRSKAGDRHRKTG